MDSHTYTDEYNQLDTPTQEPPVFGGSAMAKQAKKHRPSSNYYKQKQDQKNVDIFAKMQEQIFSPNELIQKHLNEGKHQPRASHECDEQEAKPRANMIP